MEGSGVLPGKKIQKLKPIASISGHFVPFQCTVTTMKDFLILQKPRRCYDREQTLPRLPREKISKFEANCKHSQALVPFQCTWTFDSATNHDQGQGFATFALRSSRFVAVC